MFLPLFFWGTPIFVNVACSHTVVDVFFLMFLSYTQYVFYLISFGKGVLLFFGDFFVVVILFGAG